MPEAGACGAKLHLVPRRTSSSRRLDCKGRRPARLEDMADFANDAAETRRTASTVGDCFWTTAGDSLRWS